MQQDIANGYTELHNTSRTRRVKTIFMAMRHKIDDMNTRLIASPKALPVRADERFFEVVLAQVLRFGDEYQGVL